MQANDPERRQFLGQATAVLAAAGAGAGGGLGTATSMASATPERVVDRAAPAAAAGTLWLGGWTGLYRFDGKAFVHMTPEGPWE